MDLTSWPIRGIQKHPITFSSNRGNQRGEISQDLELWRKGAKGRQAEKSRKTKEVIGILVLNHILQLPEVIHLLNLICFQLNLNLFELFSIVWLMISFQFWFLLLCICNKRFGCEMILMGRRRKKIYAICFP